MPISRSPSVTRMAPTRRSAMMCAASTSVVVGAQVSSRVVIVLATSSSGARWWAVLMNRRSYRVRRIEDGPGIPYGHACAGLPGETVHLPAPAGAVRPAVRGGHDVDHLLR